MSSINDIKNIKIIVKKDPEIKFLELAKKLLINSELVIKDESYHLIEIEFYLHSPDHQDKTVHCHPDQLKYQSWYWHRTSNKTDAGYKNPPYSGLDWTLGDEKSNIYFGVLIRGIYNEKYGPIIGPCNVVKHILKMYEWNSINDFVKSQAMNSKNQLIINDTSSNTSNNIKDNTIYYGPRVGLTTKIPEKVPWIDIKYRFCKYYTMIKKDKKKLSVIK